MKPRARATRPAEIARLQAVRDASCSAEQPLQGSQKRRATELFAGWYPVEYLGDTVETLVYAARRGMRVKQIPVAMRTRLAGTPSHSPVKAMVYLFRAAAILVLATLRR